MQLTEKGLRSGDWKEKGYELFSFDREVLKKETAQNPVWVHFGAGNIFRGFPAALMQTLVEKGLAKSGIVVGEGFDYEIISDVYKPHDNLTLLVTLKADGSIGKKVIGTVCEAYPCDYQFASEWKRFVEVFENPSLEMVSFTITEKGYALKNADGAFFPLYLEDFAAGPGSCKMFLSKLTHLLYLRYRKGQLPLALCSMDNCSHNGEKLENAVLTIAKEWVKNGLVEKGFVGYLTSDKVSFPWSMIDKITPRPDASVQAMLEKDGYEGAEPIITSKHTYISSFVNAEEPQYLVIEDKFPNGRPALEKAGVYFTSRDTVNKVEKMKVCTCLNPLHTALAVFGCLLDYTLIADEMKDPELVKLVNIIGYKEGLPVVVNPGILSPDAFIKQVLEVRIPNPFMPDTPQRIATDTSQKLSIRFGETIKAYLASNTLDVKDLHFIPMVYAGWLRYVMGIDDNGVAFTPSSDPLLSYAEEAVKGIKLGDKGPFDAQLHAILSNEKIFGVDLVAIGMDRLVLDYFTQFVAGKGAIRQTLKKYLD